MRPSRIITLVAIGIVATGCVRRGPVRTVVPAYVPASIAVPVAPAPIGYAASVDGAYRLGPGDRLRVVVFGQEGLSNTYTVDATGSVTMPLIGSVSALGQTTGELSQSIAARLRKGYIREPHVAVEVETYRPFFILGEVSNPGQYPYVANMTVETAIAIAGGFSPRAFKGKVTVTRQVNGQSYRSKVPTTFPLHPGDTITVSERWF